MMWLESLRDPSGIVVLIHGRDAAILSALVESFKSLSRNHAGDVRLHEVLGMNSDDGCQVTATNRPGRLGIWAESRRDSFRWSQDSEGWLQVAELAEPIAQSVNASGAHFQYLEERGDATVILSTERAWQRRLTRRCSGLARRLRLLGRR